ncbi:FAD-dependent oxidoreductase [Hyalangium versicolor]|uniref:FAD-dependent oxidoreductase n=1 Tax=Hyalangium versicolor TaxID=2861190 RepID=UPI001CCADCD2|nr:FAD-dependent oxidoreductase [Hyalangium versicolor]
MHEKTSREERVPVLIVGGGLVGLSTALFLAHHGVKALVLEKHEGTSIHPRARGFHVRTIELFRSTCAREEIERVGGVPSRFEGGGQLVALTLAGPVYSWMPAAPAAQSSTLSPCPHVYLGQDRLEPILLRAAREQQAEVRFSHELKEFTQDAEGVSARVLDRATGEAYTVRADYLVAADGVRSFVREALGIRQQGRGSLGHNVSTLFHADLSPVRKEHPFVFALLKHPEAGGVLVPTDVKDRWSYTTKLDAPRETPADFTEERWTRLIRLATGLPELVPTLLGTFPWEAAERVAERFSSGRVFLAGDAAHQMPPTGGHGANTGIQDAGNLAWKLAAVLKGHAGPSLLETYDSERRPVAAATANQATLLSLRLMKRDAPPEDDGAVSAQVIIFGYGYGSDEPLPKKLSLSGEPGTRAPHVWLASGESPLSTIDLFGASFVLLAGERSWLEASRALSERTGVPLHAHLVDGWQGAYGVGSSGASLIRPDGMVAARWGEASGDAERLLSEALAAATRRG